MNEEERQYMLIQEFLCNDNFHFNHLMIKGIINFLYDKFGSEFWEYIIDVIRPDLFKRFRKAKWEYAEQDYQMGKAYKFEQKERKRQEEKRQRNKEIDEEDREYRRTHPWDGRG